MDIEALCKLLKTCGKYMDKDEKAHKMLVKYIGMMKKCAKPFGFRVVVLVDEIVEMSENKWKTRFKKEKAKKLSDLHEDFEKLQMKHQQIQSHQQQRPPQSNQNHNNSPRRPQYKKKDDSPRKRNKKKKKNNNNNSGSKFGGGGGGNKSKFGSGRSSFGNHLL